MIGPFNILLAESDMEIAMITKNYLTSLGYPTIICNNGKDALSCFKSEKLSFVIVDANLPLTNSFDLVKEIHRVNNELPIFLIGNLTRHDDIVKGLRAGAIEFLACPFSIEELGLRINAILKLQKLTERSKHTVNLGHYRIDTERHMLIINNKERHLTTKEMELLLLFIDHLNRVVERRVALKKIWNQENYFSARNMDVYIKKLRSLLCEDPNIRLENVHGVGYKLSVFI